MSPRLRTSGPALAAALAAGLAACVAVPPGIRTERPEATDRVVVRAPPRGWERLAVVPFGGDPAHRRPAEELVAVRLRRSVPVAVVSPFAVQRWYRGAGGGGEPPEAAERWVLAYDQAGGAELPRDEIRAVARGVGADALVLGRVAPGGASADLVLVEGESGEPVAALRRAGSARAAQRGIHELAMSATSRALADLVEVLRTPPGKAPHVAAPGQDSAASTEEEP